MAKFRKPELLQAASGLLCAAVAWVRLDDIGASEFRGGWLTGVLFAMAVSGNILFILSVVLTFLYRRVAAAIVLLATLLSLPLYLYLIAPGPFRWVFKGEYSVPLRANFVWNNWAIAGMTTLLIATLICLRSFSNVDRKVDPLPGS